MVLALYSCASSLEITKIKQAKSFSRQPVVELSDVPFFPQTQYQCGPASLAMMLSWSGINILPETLIPYVYVPDRQGSFQVEMVTAVRRNNRIPYILSPSFDSLIRELTAGHPVLVLQNLGLSWYTKWHYAVVVGIDFNRNDIILHSGTIQQYRLDLDTFERTWQRAGKWALVVLPPGQLPVTAEPMRYIKAITAVERAHTKNLVVPAYQSAMVRWPDNIIVKMGLANIFLQQAEYDRAAKLYLEVIAIDASYAPAHNNLAQVLLAQKQLDLALKHVNEAMSLGGRHIENYRDTLQQIQQAQKMSQ